MKVQQRAQYQIFVDGVPRAYRDPSGYRVTNRAVPEIQEDPNSTVKLKDLQTGEEAIIAFKAGE